VTISQGKGQNQENHTNKGLTLMTWYQWRTQKIFMEGFHSVAYGGYLYLVCAVCDVTIWRHMHVSKQTFSLNLLTQYAYSSTHTPLIYVSWLWI